MSNITEISKAAAVSRLADTLEREAEELLQVNSYKHGALIERAETRRESAGLRLMARRIREALAGDGDEPRVRPADTVYIARCPNHGLHGQRDKCYVCGGPVEQVAMVPAATHQAPDTDALIERCGFAPLYGESCILLPEHEGPHSSEHLVEPSDFFQRNRDLRTLADSLADAREHWENRADHWREQAFQALETLKRANDNTELAEAQIEAWRASWTREHGEVATADEQVRIDKTLASS